MWIYAEYKPYYPQVREFPTYQEASAYAAEQMHEHRETGHCDTIDYYIARVHDKQTAPPSEGEW